MQATITIKPDCVISPIADAIYSSFLEHMGRAVYTGIYEPTHFSSDPDGLREDVLALVRPLALEYVRYPGGNFVSGYQWRDGIGPKAKRPTRLDLAWEAIESNQFGIDEFMKWAEKAHVKPMIAVNLGTGTPKEAAELIEYLNAPEDSTTLARLRAENGHPAPYGIDLVCLGNEMDGPWQICAKTAEEYARIAHETAKMIKWIDPHIKLVACGSSNRGMATFGTWERTVLRECWDVIDYLSLHTYYADENDTASFLSRSQDMDDFIKEVKRIVDEVAREKGSDKKIGLSFDEWNVWYHFRQKGVFPKKWTCPRSIDEEDYNGTDAVLVGGMLSTLLNNADSVKIACLAQLVNVISPITTIPGGDAFVRSIYHPFHAASKAMRGNLVEFDLDGPTYWCATRPDAAYMDCTVCRNGEELGLLVTNKSPDEPIQLHLHGISGRMSAWHSGSLEEKDHEPCNLDCIVLEPYTWNVITIKLDQ